MISGKSGDKVKIDDKLITLQNSYKLITNANNIKYYEIEINNNKKFKIDENNLLKIITVRIDDVNYYNKWFTKDNKIYCNINNCNINVVKYLFNKINDAKFRYTIINNVEFDYRIENIKVIKPSKRNTEDRFIKMDSPPIFYKEDEIRIIQEFQGHKIVSGPHYGKYFNNYRLVEIINETDESKKRYYEMFVGVYDEDDEDENNDITESINTKFSFIFDEASLPKILKLEENGLIINNPSWLIATVQYICTRPSNGQLIYLHRYLSNCKNGDNKTIDHINNNKLDNRICNLRVATMSEQNMNRDNVTRKNDLNSILNPTNDETIPRIETKSLLFINKKKSDGLEYFSLEISKARTRDKEIRENSSKSSILSLKEKLCHMIYKRYEYICKYPIIMNEKIDSKQFTTTDEFKLHSEMKINELLGSETVTYTLDSFLDYLNSKKIPKYVDPRIKLRLESRTTNQSLVTPSVTAPSSDAPISDTHTSDTPNTTVQPIENTYIHKIDDKFTFIDNGINSRDISIKITKNIKDNIRVSGSGSKKLSIEDKLCFALMNRYFALIEHENAINLEIHKDDLEDSAESANTQNITINKNTTGKKTLSDLVIDGNKFTNFNDFKKHTEKIIKDIMITIPDNNFTIETFNKYIVDKIIDKRCNKPIPILNTKYPILTT
jgi:hypothetical protein